MKDRGRLILGGAIAASVLLHGAGVALGVAWLRCGGSGCPDVGRLRAYQPGKASRVLDRHGRYFAELRPVEGATAPLKQVSPHLRAAFLAVEDKRFYRHRGVDFRRAAGAALANLRQGGFGQGFSTITMQLARNVFPDRIRGRERTLSRKLVEMRVAYEIEERYDKDEILELYLSHIYFGNGARGVQAAARHYFGTTAGRLTLPQAALLAALPKGPAAYDPRRHPQRARERRNLVLTLMEEQGRISPEEAEAARQAPLGVSRWQGPAGQAPSPAPYFVEEVRRQLEERFGERVYAETLEVTTTLDFGLQRAAEEELERQLRAVESGRLGRFTAPRYAAAALPLGESTPYLQGALVALEVGSGDVLAWVGGRDFRHSRFDRVQASRRQTGSAFKPFVYAAALEAGHPLSEHLLDEPMRVQLARNRWWEPRNYDHDYQGVVTMREALVRSKNIPTVRLAAAVGLDTVARVAREAGIHSPIDPTPAMPLGTVAVSPLELATAYGAFAGLGQAAAPRLVLRVQAEDGEELLAAGAPATRRVMEEGVAYLVNDVLHDAVMHGTGAAVAAAGLRGAVAGKTGTTNDATDAWFVGYTPELVAAVWVGFDEPRTIMRAATGGRLAAPAWAQTVRRFLAGRRAARDWRVPESVFAAWVDRASGYRVPADCPDFGQAYRELFIRGRAPRAVCPEPDHGFWTEWPRGGWEDWEEEAEERRREAKERRREADERRRERWERRREAREEAERRRMEAEEDAQRKARKEAEKRRKQREKRRRELERYLGAWGG